MLREKKLLEKLNSRLHNLYGIAFHEIVCLSRPLKPSRALGDNVIMAKKFKAVYENGVLRPLEPLLLKEHQEIVLKIFDPLDRWVDHKYLKQVKREVALRGPAPSLEEVRQALSKIPGNLTDDIRAERDGL